MAIKTGSVGPLWAQSIPCAVVLACACACAPDEPGRSVGSTTQGITNGANDSNDPAVVGLVDVNGKLVCTGTLVSPDVVLTAAHCLEGATTDLTDSVFFGSSLGAGGTSVPVSGALVHPLYDPSTLANDLALLALASPASETPVPVLAPTPDASLVSATVRIVGFGETEADAGDFGQKRTGSSTISSVTATSLALAPDPSQPCSGDSGGPALLTVGGVEYLAGVTSHGDAACVAGAFDTRADAYAAPFIGPFVAACEAQGCPTACDPIGTACPTGLECDNVDGGIDFSCVPGPAAAKAHSSSSCSSARGLTNERSSDVWLPLGVGLGLGLAAARRRSSRPHRHLDPPSAGVRR